MISPNENDPFICGITEATRKEELKQEQGMAPGPFYSLLNYMLDKEGMQTFPPTNVWQFDRYLVLCLTTDNSITCK